MEIVDIVEVYPSVSGKVESFGFLGKDDAERYLEKCITSEDPVIEIGRVSVSLNDLHKMVMGIPVETTYAIHHVGPTADEIQLIEL